MIHVFIGTKAQYIKTAPLMRHLDATGHRYNLIDSGQHSGLTPLLRKELDLREPDVSLRRGLDLKTIPAVLSWLFRSVVRAILNPAAVRQKLFRGDHRGLCVIHGDTPSTLLSAFLARTAGLKIAHLEAGLRSFNYLHPFPEELIRVIVMRWADLLFAPSDGAAANLAKMEVGGSVINVGANTNVDALRYSLTLPFNGSPPPSDPFILVTIHRVETLHSSRKLRQVVQLILGQAQHRQVVFILHPPTEMILKKKKFYPSLTEASNLILLPLLPHGDFLRYLQRADFVITDGGSVQEECALLGKPCLLMRRRTERLDGIGSNVVLSAFEPERIQYFLEHWKEFTCSPADLSIRPSERIARVLQRYEESSAGTHRQSVHNGHRAVAEVSHD
jgi:UDP-N-acetylglucosamine 2-epimerase (non-hydrolysing)